MYVNMLIYITENLHAKRISQVSFHIHMYTYYQFLGSAACFFSVLFAVFLTFTIAWKGITYSKCNQHTFGEMQIYTHTHIQTQTLYFYPLRTCGSSSGADILIPCRQFAN